MTATDWFCPLRTSLLRIPLTVTLHPPARQNHTLYCT